MTMKGSGGHPRRPQRVGVVQGARDVVVLRLSTAPSRSCVHSRDGAARDPSTLAHVSMLSPQADEARPIVVIDR
jgi:hypothetical protein